MDDIRRQKMSPETVELKKEILAQFYIDTRLHLLVRNYYSNLSCDRKTVKKINNRGNISIGTLFQVVQDIHCFLLLSYYDGNKKRNECVITNNEELGRALEALSQVEGKRKTAFVISSILNAATVINLFSSTRNILRQRLDSLLILLSEMEKSAPKLAIRYTENRAKLAVNEYNKKVCELRKERDMLKWFAPNEKLDNI